MICRDNYLLTREYLRYLSEVRQRDSTTVYRHKSWLNHTLQWLDDVPLPAAQEKRPVLPRYLLDVARMTPNGIKRTLQSARQFFDWLMLYHAATYPAITLMWIATLQPPRQCAAVPRKEPEGVTLEMVRAIVALPRDDGDLLTWRDQAAAAFLFLSGMRPGAFCSLPVECVELSRREIKQFPSLGVQTKSGKYGLTHLYNIPDLLAVVVAWDAYLRAQQMIYWYPNINVAFGLKQRLVGDPPTRHRRNALNEQMQKILVRAGCPPLTAHKFRHGHAQYGLERAASLADYKAVSLNLMHSSLFTTDKEYAFLKTSNVAARIARLSQASPSPAGGQLATLLRTLLAEIEREAEPEI